MTIHLVKIFLEEAPRTSLDILDMVISPIIAPGTSSDSRSTISASTYMTVLFNFNCFTEKQLAITTHKLLLSSNWKLEIGQARWLISQVVV